MNLLQVKGMWNIAKGKLLQRLALLTGNEQQFMNGKETELTGRIQERARRNKTKHQQFK